MVRARVSSENLDPSLARLGLPTPQTLSAARLLARLSQSGLAALAGVSITVIKRYELGETRPTMRTLEKITAALRASGVVILPTTEQFRTGVALL